MSRMTPAQVIDYVEARSRSQFNTPNEGCPLPHRISVDRYGQHASYTKDGRRYWGFDTKRGRDRFADDYARNAVVLNARTPRKS